MNINLKASPYRIYLLTLWAERGEQTEAPAIWRCSLKDPQTGQQRAFATLTALVAALVEEMARVEGAPARASLHRGADPTICRQAGGRPG